MSSVTPPLRKVTLKKKRSAVMVAFMPGTPRPLDARLSYRDPVRSSESHFVKATGLSDHGGSPDA